ncbi:lytic transglycosylase domain-containing protein [Rhodopseudomonas palustris]|uniref:lytic transglycosylase domain-containing protein n=1 Tax=Rhodopseudomonas palustris TaxID=1076 RepID=UPI0020CE2717|nr:lytic transglycosylase domain-containing protein [Rhodopseudomonas palustris]MCP9626484.1 lytic transglycosylase domain-containing protein [Rhodopseudomonas palustris]
MRSRVIIAFKGFIPLFAKKPSHPFVPLDRRTAGARSAGQGRPSAGAWRGPLTVASTLAGWRRGGERQARRHAVLVVIGALALCAGPGASIAQSMPAARSVVANLYAAHIAEASQRFGIPERWIRAVLRAESGGDVRAISSAGAIGLMQVMPDTWSGLRVRYGLGRDPYQPRDNILAGTAYMREMWDRYGNVAAMLAAYNAGPARYDEYRATGRALPAETRAYVAVLVPAFGGTTAPDAVARRTAPPPDWRDAPLFVVRPNDSRPIAALPSADTRATVPVRGRLTAEPKAGSMFVARAGDGATP